MKLSMVKTRVEECLSAGGKITQSFIGRLSPALLSQCTKSAYTHWHKTLYRKLYSGSGLCICDEETEFINMRRGFRPFCSRKCANSSEHHHRKVIDTCQKKYGTNNPMQAPAVRRRFKKTMNDLYGVTWAAQSQKLKRRQSRTMMQRYGVTTISQIPEVARANAIKFRENSEAHQAKRSATMIERYGVAHNLQSRALLEKQQRSAFKMKSFTLDGKTFHVRGYEDTAIRYLHEKLRVEVRHIKVTAKEGVPSIRYENGLRVYHPDIYAKVKGKWYIIEVKSDYTAGLKPRSSLFTVLRKKMVATADAGYRPKLLVVTPKGDITVVHKPHLCSKAEVKYLVYDK